MDGFTHNIKVGAPIRIRKVVYTGYASTIYSVDQAVQILDFIGQKSKSDDILPFAVRLVEGKEFIEIAEDNNEFACGELLARCLDNYEGYNMVVCVSRHVEGCFVSDSVQHLKLRAVKEAAISALEILHKELISHPVDEEGLTNNNQNVPDNNQNEKSSHNTRKIVNKKNLTNNNNAESLNTTSKRKSPIIFDPFSETVSEISTTKRPSKGKLMKLQPHIPSKSQVAIDFTNQQPVTNSLSKLSNADLSSKLKNLEL
mmetsp:Transcript_5930/g.6050  ORF Transcript_5930/g.6050 Transcript_5930/m.6050 type:complete len:257 (+) Transcript_5930:145-915(+)|eukprot:CAMPEP_0119035928 /NCGR_PEP_ID=MMETSP1177-20130426/3223_1 /TAXON_ID=2985 /ORGANISM="Ochromonas sp, Strain CCMP1899" /LENGTH=256 /DNA_ID=CAMNT_0006994867 /DNA_START=126 /DNA_END=896 /DNA_ORIENTATION=+